MDALAPTDCPGVKIPLPKFIAEQAGRLESAGIGQAAAEVEWILCHVLDVSRLDLYLYGERLLTPERLARVEGIIERRLTREPLQYILGEAWFYGRKFVVTPAVMVPTPETEGLVERALGFVRAHGLEAARVLDVGIGSGVIGCTVACELPSARVLGLDISREALAMAARNAEMLGVADRVRLRQSDFFASVDPHERFDLILANPPYIAEPEYPALAPEVRADPKIAMTAGPDGLDAIRVIVREAPRFLAAGGRIMFEIGYNQAPAVSALVEADRRYHEMTIVKDLNDIDRIVILACE